VIPVDELDAISEDMRFEEVGGVSLTLEVLHASASSAATRVRCSILAAVAAKVCKGVVVHSELKSSTSDDKTRPR
jgi:hypothetical protein